MLRNAFEGEENNTSGFAFWSHQERILKNDTEDFDFAGRRSARTVLRREQVHVQCDLRDAGKNSALKFILIAGS